jgi:regulator of protease activity HflC (stomatin/prohibitin superfamily)
MELFRYLIYSLRNLCRIARSCYSVVLRLGKYQSTSGPGLVIIIPFIDQPIYVNLTKQIPEWRSLEETEIKKKVEDMVLNDPDPKKYK